MWRKVAMHSIKFIRHVMPYLFILSALFIGIPQSVQAKWELLVTEIEQNVSGGTVWSFDGTSGELIGPFTPERSIAASSLQTLAIGPDGNLYVAEFEDGVARFDGKTGEFIDQFIPAGTGGLSGADQLVFKDGFLYVSSRFTSQILRFDATTGAFVDIFVSDPNLNGFIKFTFGPDGNIYAGTFNGQQEIYRYDGTDGHLIDTFSQNHPVIDSAYGGLAFGPDGDLYASRYHASLVERYDGDTGQYLDTFASFGNGAPPPSTVPRADSLVLGPDDNLYVATFDGSNPASVLQIDGVTGAVLSTFAQPPHTGNGIGGVLFREVSSTDYEFSGFFPPVRNPPGLNKIRAGKPVPFKFSLNGDQGLEILASGWPASRRIKCASGRPLNQWELSLPPDEKGLTYNSAIDQYLYLWKTLPKWAGSCREFNLKLNDGGNHKARFKFR